MAAPHEVSEDKAQRRQGSLECRRTCGRVHWVAELRRREGEAAPPEELAERRRLVLRLQERLAYVVRDLLTIQRTSNGTA